LCVAGDRFTCVSDTKANQRRFKLIAQVSKELKHDALLASAASEKVVDNGQTEGQINRLNALKRAMYGRAGPETGRVAR
jgi:transposase